MARPWILRGAVIGGGFVGSLGRHLVQETADLGRLPWGTLLANVLGAFLLGVLTTSVGRMRHPEFVAALLGVGAVGAFTTFSALIGQLANLPWTRAAAYIVITIVLGLVAVVLGIQAGKQRT